MEAHRCPNGHVTYPGHPRCPTCREEQVETLDLSDQTARIVTWTNATATPPGVRNPNPIAVVEFTVDGSSVRAIGQLITSEVSIGDRVRPVYTQKLREPGEGIRLPESQSWDGYRFEPV